MGRWRALSHAYPRVGDGRAPEEAGVPGEDELRGRGIAFCAVCDAPLFADRHTLVVGGGDSAMEEALGLARHAASVTLVHRRDSFRAPPIMVQRVRERGVIRVVAPYVVEAFVEGSDGRLASVRLRRADGGEVREAITKLGLSDRAYDRILKVGRTIADMASAGE